MTRLGEIRVTFYLNEDGAHRKRRRSAETVGGALFARVGERRYSSEMAGDGRALPGFVLYLLIAVGPTLVLWAALRALPASVHAFGERRSAQQPPRGPALESQVADLRRLHRSLRAGDRQTHLRRVALEAAYDETLLAVCDQVDVHSPLTEAVGRDRAFARLQTEAALEEAGIVINPPVGGAAAA